MDEITEHESIEHHRGVPLLVFVLGNIGDVVINARDEVGKGFVLLAEAGVEILRDFLRIDRKGVLHLFLDIHDGGLLPQVEREAVYLGEQEIGLVG